MAEGKTEQSVGLKSCELKKSKPGSGAAALSLSYTSSQGGSELGWGTAYSGHKLTLSDQSPVGSALSAQVQQEPPPALPREEGLLAWPHPSFSQVSFLHLTSEHWDLHVAGCCVSARVVPVREEEFQ